MILIPASLPAQTYEKATIIDTIPLIGTPEESFALYLPQSFDPKTPSAVVFIFDPAARGNNGVLPFIEAAEVYDLIVVFLNNSRNVAYQHRLSKTSSFRLCKTILNTSSTMQD